jgi:hypothetical protein
LIFIQDRLQFDNSDLSIKRGCYKLVEVGLHPKANPEDLDNLDSYCYFFHRQKDDGSFGSGFRFNSIRFDELVTQGRVIVPLNKDRFLEDLRELLAKHQVSLSAGWDFDGPWDESGDISIFVNSHGVNHYSYFSGPRQQALGKVVCPVPQVVAQTKRVDSAGSKML